MFDRNVPFPLSLTVFFGLHLHLYGAKILVASARRKVMGLARNPMTTLIVNILKMTESTFRNQPFIVVFALLFPLTHSYMHAMHNQNHLPEYHVVDGNPNTGRQRQNAIFEY